MARTGGMPHQTPQWLALKTLDELHSIQDRVGAADLSRPAVRSDLAKSLRDLGDSLDRYLEPHEDEQYEPGPVS